MIDFHAPTLQDKLWAAPLLKNSGWSACEYAFGTHYIWQEKYHAEIACYHKFFLGRSGNHYLFPTGNGDLKEVLLRLQQEEKEKNGEGSLHLYAVPAPAIPTLKELFGETLFVEEDRANWDYLYLTENLIHLKGKAYHAKRNHIARFQREFSYQYEPITPKNAPECLEMAEIWQQKNAQADSVDELHAMRRAFSAWDALGFVGGLIRVDGKVVAFTAGEELNQQTFDLHFEKARPEFEGAYAVINQEFAARCLSEYSLVNREEDMGLEGLRKAKESYRPVAMFEKYTVTVK